MGSERAGRLGLMMIGFATFAFLTANITASPATTLASGKSYALAVSGWSDLRLIELGTDWPTKTHSAADRLMFCRHVMRISDFEVGARCAPEATTIADASQ